VSETNDTAILAARKSESRQPLKKEDEKGEFAKTIVLAVLLALFIRTFFYEPFNIPSGSMLPTLQIGDYLFVSKMSYGYSRYSFPLGLIGVEGRMMGEEPKRGDVIVFRQPPHPKVDFIKRLVGMPGDKIQVNRGRLYINGELVPRQSVGMRRIAQAEGGHVNVMEYIETLPGGVQHIIYEESDSEPLDMTEEVTVPEGHYFMMGDNRDNSQDSRVDYEVGFVPFENLVGRAEIIFFSIDETANLFKPWTWPGAIRYGRILGSVGPDRDKMENAEEKKS
jgi:signal peptidase I